MPNVGTIGEEDKASRWDHLLRASHLANELRVLYHQVLGGHMVNLSVNYTLSICARLSSPDRGAQTPAPRYSLVFFWSFFGSFWGRFLVVACSSTLFLYPTPLSPTSLRTTQLLAL